MTFQGDIHDGTEVFDNDGHRIGKVGQVFVLQGTDTPTWAAVQTGLFGMQESFVPVADATMRGGELIVPFAKDFVKDAPRITDSDDLTAEQEMELYRYYGVEPPRQSGAGAGAAAGAGAGAGAAAGAGTAGAMGDDRDRADHGRHDEHDRGEHRHDDEQRHDEHRRDEQSHDDQSHDDRRAQGAHASTDGARGDDRERGSHDSEHSSQSGSGSGASGAPRLRRRIVTEMQTVQVPVQREEIVVEGEGIAPDDERDSRR